MSTLVLKIGGRVGGLEGALADLPAVLQAGHQVCIVHGGGPEISRWMDRLALPVRFKNGLRVTDEAALEVATMVLRGSVNTALVGNLAWLGVSAVGLSGVDGGLITALPHEDPDLGLVGQAGLVRPSLLSTLLERGMVPVIAPIALDEQGQLRNLNADIACGAVASALRADLAVFLTDVPGVLDDQGRQLPRLSAAEVEALIAAGTIHGGMVPKVGACLAALRRGAQAVCIADGRATGTLLAISEGRAGQGTIIRQEAWT